MREVPIVRYFDPIKKQLIYIESKASSSFWDSHWKLDKNIRHEILGRKDTFVSHITKQYLKPKDGIILEGGCGRGHYVASLGNNGYRVIGIDFAKKTVNILNQYLPELDIRFGDVRKLPFKDNYFIGYWSLGVIEHFWEDYELIALEMSRVIKDNGYLFLVFPYMSPLRRMKARLGLYDLWHEAIPTDNFYQFALNSKLVFENFQKIGFKLIRARPFDGIKGTKDEIAIIKPLLQKLYDYKGNNRFINRFRAHISTLLSPKASHCILLILRKCAQ